MALLRLLALKAVSSCGALGREQEIAESQHSTRTGQRRLQEACRSVEDCAALAHLAARPFANVFQASEPERGKSACKAIHTKAALLAAPANNAVARANAYWENCDHSAGGKKWTRADARGYFNATWQPDVNLGGASCRSMSRFGPPMGKDGDGGKMLCEADRLFSGQGCLVVSVGLNDDTRFEQDLHRERPECEIVGMDGTLDANKTALVPKFIQFLPNNFNGKTHQQFATRRRVSLLKIDCDGCEYNWLGSWTDHICTDQIIVEMHRWTFSSPRLNADRIHRLMLHLHRAGYRIAFLEPNPYWPKLGTEYTLVRNTSCPR